MGFIPPEPPPPNQTIWMIDPKTQERRLVKNPEWQEWVDRKRLQERERENHLSIMALCWRPLFWVVIRFAYAVRRLFGVR